MASLSKRPWGLEWRSSVWFVTAVVGLGITTDLLVYSVVIPVLPFHLEELGYTGVSALTGWLLFGYSGGIVFSTPIIAVLSERYNSRRWPLLIGQFVLIGSQVMLMEAPKYWLMVIARVIQGISSAVIWVVGLALLCDTAPAATIGRQLGLAMSGLSLGLLIGPPVGGTLFKSFGFRAPFVCSVIVTLIDVVGRLLIIERREAQVFGFDPAAPPAQNESIELEKAPVEVSTENVPNNTDVNGTTPNAIEATVQDANQPTPNTPAEKITLMGVVATLLHSRRALAAIFISMTYGIVLTTVEPALPLHLQDIWHLNSSGVGLVFLAAVIPTIFSSGIAGWWTDKKGPEWLTITCLILSSPWWGIMIIQKSLALFLVALAFQSFFTAGVVSPLTAELAAVSRANTGVGYGHVYGAFQLAYGIGSAAGPIIGGQVYEHVELGWLTICVLSIGLFIVCTGLAVSCIGEEPLLARALRRHKKRVLERTSTAPTPTPVLFDPTLTH